MTLDEARDWFEQQPNVAHAWLYFLLARDYRDDGMITPETFAHIAQQTAELRGE